MQCSGLEEVRQHIVPVADGQWCAAQLAHGVGRKGCRASDPQADCSADMQALQQLLWDPVCLWRDCVHASICPDSAAEWWCHGCVDRAQEASSPWQRARVRCLPSEVVACLIAICDRADTDTAAHVVGAGGGGGSRREGVANQNRSSAM